MPATDCLRLTTNNFTLTALIHGHHQVTRALVDRIRLAAVLGLKTLDDRTRIDPCLRDEKRITRRSRFLLVRVGDGGADYLFDHAADALLGETQERKRVVDVAAADQVHHQPRLARGDAGESMFGLVGHLATSSNHFAGAAAGAPASAALRPLWPRKIRVGENSPSLCPTMSSCTNTRRNLLPLWTSNVCPTNSGMIVQARAHVRIGCLARFSLSLLTFL